MLGELDLNTYGEGWDTVLTATLPEDVLSMPFAEGRPGAERDGDQGSDRGGFAEGSSNPLELLGTLGKQVSGDFGTGYVINTNVGTALITEDGKVAIGAVPEQVVIEAAEQMK